jgi:prepilin-type N-terminal cleavage/methylation domain-containing protein
MIMQKKQKQGFTLIEILIVVAIIAILASVVLVGLGPTQQQGRDARRLSDLREVQTALELYYNKNGVYPDGSTWGVMTTALVGGSIGVSQIPNDPSTNGTYYYQSFASDSTYVIGAKLESANNSVFTGYAPPSVGTPTSLTCAASDKQYCLSL